MKFYYLFLFLSLFVQTPEAESLIVSVQSAVAQLGHGSVEVTQGRSSIDVYVKCKGKFTVQLVRMSDGVQVDGDRGFGHDVFRFEQSVLSAGSYEVRVVFIDEAFRVEAVCIEVKE